jgi:phenylpyruvate tautomerase PptA (4-oxalocrotonate tautomerase family)
MPLLRIETNVPRDGSAAADLLAAASRLVAESLAKPERYVMVSLHHNADMRFAASHEPLAYLELKSIGLPGDRTPELSAALSGFVEKWLGVPKDRTYIEFSDAPRHLWGWNAGTF